MIGNRVVLVVLCAALVACGGGQRSDSTEVKELTVASYKRPCTGVADQRCLRLKAGAGDAWENYYDGIAGFTFAWGREQRLLVQETVIANPPADASSLQLTLVAVTHVREDASGSEYVLSNVTLSALALAREGAEIYRLYGEPFACAPATDCATLLSLNGSNRRVDMRFTYASTAAPPITPIAWAETA